MATRRGFLKFLGIGSAAAVVAPIAAKALPAVIPEAVPRPLGYIAQDTGLKDVSWGMIEDTPEFFPPRTYPVDAHHDNPYVTSKQQVGLGKINPFDREDLVGIEQVEDALRNLHRAIKG